jgi:hypothetical protein
MRSFALIALASAGAILVSPSCASLPDVAHGACGNGVVEPHEDCDTFPTDTSAGLHCGAPGSAEACRYVASTAADCPKAAPAYVLGTDGVCRQPSDRFRESFTLDASTGLRAQVADFDGDGIGDLLRVPTDHARRAVDYMSGVGLSETRFFSSPATAHATASELDPTLDPQADVVLPGGGGLATLRGLPDRGFTPRLYAPVGTEDAYVFKSPGEIVGPVFSFDAVGAVLGAPSGEVIACFTTACGQSTVLESGVASFSPDALRGFFAGALPGFVYLRSGAHEALVVPFSAPASPGAVVHVSSPVPGPSLGPNIGAADVDGDGQLDLVASVLVPSGSASDTVIVWARGPIAGPGPLTFAPVPNAKHLGAGVFLGASDLNGDGFADLVSDLGMQITQESPVSPGTFTYVDHVGATDGTPWQELAFADFNHDGFGDAALASDAAGLDLVLGGPKQLLVRARLSSDAPMKTLELGDLDGDGAVDLVGTTREHADCGGSQEVLAYFGRPLAFPDGPTLLAEAPGVRQLLALRTGGAPADSGDGIDDLIILYGGSAQSCDKAGRGGLLFGSADRELLSPYALDPDLAFSPFTTAAGDANGDAYADVLAIGSLREMGKAVFDNTAFLVLGTGDGEFVDNSIVVHAALPTTAGYTPYFWGAAFGGAPRPDALVFMPRPAPGCAGTSCAMIVDATVLRFTDDGASPIPVTGLPSDPVATDLARSDFIEQPRVVAVDFDHDGDVDFAAVTPFDEKHLPGRVGAAFLFRNDGDSYAALPLGSIDDEPVVDFAVATDKDGQRRHLVAATGLGIYGVEGGSTLLLARAAPPRLSSDGQGGGAPSRSGTDRRITSVTTGDLTGDGLEDIAMVTTEGTVVFERLAALFADEGVFSINPADVVAPLARATTPSP